jgi:hypothetical protein
MEQLVDTWLVDAKLAHARLIDTWLVATQVVAHGRMLEGSLRQLGGHGRMREVGDRLGVWGGLLEPVRPVWLNGRMLLVAACEASVREGLLESGLKVSIWPQIGRGRALPIVRACVKALLNDALRWGWYVLGNVNGLLQRSAKLVTCPGRVVFHGCSQCFILSSVIYLNINVYLYNVKMWSHTWRAGVVVHQNCTSKPTKTYLFIFVTGHVSKESGECNVMLLPHPTNIHK